MRRLRGDDHVVHGPALERMHGRGPGVVEVAQLRIAPREFQRSPVLQPERHLAVLDGAAVDQPEGLVVARPADAVPGAHHPPSTRVPQAGLRDVGLDSGEVFLNGAVVGLHDAPVTADQRGQRDGFRGGERQVVAC